MARRHPYADTIGHYDANSQRVYNDHWVGHQEEYRVPDLENPDTGKYIYQEKYPNLEVTVCTAYIGAPEAQGMTNVWESTDPRARRWCRAVLEKRVTDYEETIKNLKEKMKRYAQEDLF